MFGLESAAEELVPRQSIVQATDPSRILTIEQLNASAKQLLEQCLPRTVMSLFHKCSPALERGIEALRGTRRRLIPLDDEKKAPKQGPDLLDTPELCHIILGPPGVGKTFFLWQLAHSLLKDGRQIPLFVRASELDHAEDLLEVIGAAAPGLRAEDVLRDPRTVVFLDGWSEFASENKRTAVERARVLRMLAGKRLIATGRRQAFVHPVFSMLELDPIAWSEVLKVLRISVPGAVPPPGLSELLRLPLPLILYLLSDGRATTRGELLAELHQHLSEDLPPEFRDVLAGAVADVDIGAGGRKRSALLESLRNRAGKRGLREFESCLRRLGTLEIHSHVVSPIHDLYWSWLSGVGLLIESRIQAVIRRMLSRESVRLAIESGVPVHPREVSATMEIDIVFAAQLSLGVPQYEAVHNELVRQISREMASPLASRRARGGLAALIVKDARSMARAIEIVSEAIVSKWIFNPDEIELDVESLYEHRVMVGEQLNSPAAGYLLGWIAERGEPRWVPWLAEMAREGKAARHLLVGAALACSATIPEWTREHLGEVVREHAFHLRHCTKRGTNVALANWIAERFGDEFIASGNVVLHLADLLDTCGDDNTYQRLLERVDSLSEQMLQLLGYVVVKFGEPWIGHFQERMFARGSPRAGYGPLAKMVSASVSEVVAREWIESEDDDVALLGWRVLIERIGASAVGAELPRHMPASFAGVHRVPALEALQYLVDAPDELGKDIWRRVNGELMPRFGWELMRSLGAMPEAGYGPLIWQLLATPEMLPTDHFMQFLPAFRSWEQRRGFKIMHVSGDTSVPFLDWLILRRLDGDRKDKHFAHVNQDCREIIAHTGLTYFSKHPAFLVDLLRELNVAIPYDERLAEFVASMPSTVSLIPSLFAKSLGELPEALLLRVIDVVGFELVFLLDNLASSSNPAHMVLHRRVIRWAVDVQRNLWAYRAVAKILRVHEPTVLRRILTEELVGVTDYSLELIREVERTTVTLLIDESGAWLVKQWDNPPARLPGGPGGPGGPRSRVSTETDPTDFGSKYEQERSTLRGFNAGQELIHHDQHSRPLAPPLVRYRRAAAVSVVLHVGLAPYPSYGIPVLLLLFLTLPSVRVLLNRKDPRWVRIVHWIWVGLWLLPGAVVLKEIVKHKVDDLDGLVVVPFAAIFIGLYANIAYLRVSR